MILTRILTHLLGMIKSLAASQYAGPAKKIVHAGMWYVSFFMYVY